MQELAGALRAGDRRAHRPTSAASRRIAELAAHLDATEEEIVEALDASEAYTTASLDRPVGADPGRAGSASWSARRIPVSTPWSTGEVLKALLAKLPERDKRILLMRFFRGMTQAEIGDGAGRLADAGLPAARPHPGAAAGRIRVSAARSKG